MKTLTFCLALIVMSCTLAFGQAQYKVLWNFAGAPAADGAFPSGALISDSDGNLYGSTQRGGTAPASACAMDGCGTIFELSPNSDGTWSEKVLYSFCASPVNGICLDGAEPLASLTFDSAGNLYGTTSIGGPAQPLNQAGIVFKLSPPLLPGDAWTESILHNFCSDYGNDECLDGYRPYSSLIFDAAGNLYGTTLSGGNGGGGTVFELSPGSLGWTETVLYSFCSSGTRYCPDGANPVSGVTFDAAGNLYGTTAYGGSNNGKGAGTLYELSPSSIGWIETLLTFPGDKYGYPLGSVTFDSTGNLYSTTNRGGGYGNVFQLDLKKHTSRALYFSQQNGSPDSGVLIDSRRHVLYGTTTMSDGEQVGSIFQISGSGKEVVIHSFCQIGSCADGAGPDASLIEDRTGNLYGTTVNGGAVGSGYGVVFELTP